jgi:hypothetical protein
MNLTFQDENVFELIFPSGTGERQAQTASEADSDSSGGASTPLHPRVETVVLVEDNRFTAVRVYRSVQHNMVISNSK